MPPLNRQDTLPSIHSWWSDNNPGLQGPTINLHATAKPLMKLMYHRQVLALIRDNCNTPLSTTTLEMYLSYFPWDYVSSSTKHAILEELISRSASEADARAIVDSSVFNDLVQMLGSSDIGARISSCRLLASVAAHESNISPILELRICDRLATLLRDDICQQHFLTSDSDDNSQVIECTLDALCRIAHSSCSQFPTDFLPRDGKMPKHVSKFLKSPLPGVREKACILLGRLSTQRPPWSLIDLDACEQLASLKRDENSRVAKAATYALSQVARWSELEQDIIIIDRLALKHVLVLLKSPIREIRQWTCQLVGRLAVHQFTAAFLLERKICRRLVSSLRYPAIRADAIFALCAISEWPDGVAALASTDIFEDLQVLSQPADVETKDRMHIILDSLAWFKAGKQLVTRLDDVDYRVVVSALDALSQRSDLGVLIQDGKVLERAIKFLKFPLPDVREMACNLLGRLAGHRPLWFRLDLDQDACEQLVSLLVDEKYPTVAEAATYALSQFARWSDVEQDMIDGFALEHVWVLLDSPIPKVQQWTCQLVGRLAVHQSTAALLSLEMKICGQLVSFLRDPAIRADAILALFAISQWPDGVAALANTNTFEELQGLSQSADVETKVQIHMILDNLAWYKAGKT